MLPHVEHGEVEAEGLDRADQPPERTARAELAAAAAAEPVRDRDQIGAQLGRGRIRRAFVGDMAGGGLAREMGERGGEPGVDTGERRSEEQTSELQSLMRISY